MRNRPELPARRLRRRPSSAQDLMRLAGIEPATLPAPGLSPEVPYLTEAQRAATMGQDILTTQGYTHMRPHSQRPVLEQLGEVLNLDAILEAAFGVAGKEPGVPASATDGFAQEKSKSIEDPAATSK